MEHMDDVLLTKGATIRAKPTVADSEISGFESPQQFEVRPGSSIWVNRSKPAAQVPTRLHLPFRKM
jgi:hypothetical protein